MSIKVKAKRCSGCRICQVVCSLENYGEVNPAKAAIEIAGEFPSPGRYNVRLCDQCGDCEEVCPVDAIYKKDGIYKIDEEECIECFECVEICPRDIMFTHEEEVPIKCINCGECVEICPRDVLSWE